MIGAVALFVVQAADPTTVNGARLGDAANFRTIGPARVCLANLTIDLAEGEYANLTYSGIHSASISVVSRDGEAVISRVEGGNSPHIQGEIVHRTEGARVYRSRTAGRALYTWYLLRNRETTGRPRVATLSGEGLAGTDMDLSLVRRIAIADGEPQHCAVRYNYGWSVIFGEEPLAVREP